MVKTLSEAEIASICEKWHLRFDKETGRIYYAPGGSAFPIKSNLFLIRHGQTELNLMQAPFQGATELAINQLNAYGQQQARDVGKALASQIVSNGAAVEYFAFASPLKRAQQTAKIAMEIICSKIRVQIPIVTNDHLLEMDYGCWNNFTLEELPEQEKLLATNYRSGNITAQPSTGGENFFSVLKRARLLLESLPVGGDKTTTCFLFAHAIIHGAIRVLLHDESLIHEGGYVDWRKNLIGNGAFHRFFIS